MSCSSCKHMNTRYQFFSLAACLARTFMSFIVVPSVGGIHSHLNCGDKHVVQLTQCVGVCWVKCTFIYWAFHTDAMNHTLRQMLEPTVA